MRTFTVEINVAGSPAITGVMHASYALEDSTALWMGVSPELLQQHGFGEGELHAPDEFVAHASAMADALGGVLSIDAQGEYEFDE